MRVPDLQNLIEQEELKLKGDPLRILVALASSLGQLTEIKITGVEVLSTCILGSASGAEKAWKVFNQVRARYILLHGEPEPTDTEEEMGLYDTFRLRIVVLGLIHENS